MQSVELDFILEGDTEEFCSISTLLIPAVGSNVTLDYKYYLNKDIPVGTPLLVTKVEYCYFNYSHRVLVTLTP